MTPTHAHLLATSTEKLSSSLHTMFARTSLRSTRAVAGARTGAINFAKVRTDRSISLPDDQGGPHAAIYSLRRRPRID